MSRIVAEKTYYEIQNLMGEGLTSEVYKAFRLDASEYTSQPVALKILKSKKHIQVLRKEFEKLQRVDSSNCVKVFGWENLKSGPALVLELLEGVTLDELICFSSLRLSQIQEIVAQVQNGLRDIHNLGLIHGDLNFKNIFITQTGVIKLLDFGVLHNIHGFFGTPIFVAPEIWRNHNYEAHSDLFSLGLIQEKLLGKLSEEQINIENWHKCIEPHYNKNSLLMESPSQRDFLKITTKKALKKELGQLVSLCLESRKSCEQTIFVEKKQKKPFLPLFVSFICSLFLTFHTEFSENLRFSQLEVKSNKWLNISMNGMPGEYAPFIKKRLRPGRYRLSWVSSKGFEKKEIQLTPNQTFILKPGLIDL